MMTDMKTIADLPPCNRRSPYRATAHSPVVIYCKPPLDKLKLLSASEAIKNAELFKTNIVTIETCQNCQERSENFQLVLKPATIEKPVKQPELLQDGTIIYQKDVTDWEPPPAPPGYKRKSDDPKSKDAWILIPEQPFCIYVEFEKKAAASCGCERYNLICTHEGKRILLLQKETCQECPYRVEQKCNV